MILKIRNRLLGGALALLLGSVGVQQVQAFTHPGVLLTNADLAELNARKNTAPYAAGYALFLNDSHTKLDYVMQGPVVEVGRNPWLNQYPWRNDLQAIFGLALQWKFTGNSAYAEKAKNILLAWANTHTKWSGVEPYLELGDYAHYLCIGASILRSYPGWTAANTTTVKNYFNNVHWPACTAAIPLRSANQGGAHLAAAMCFAIYLDDTTKFNQVVEAFRANGCTGLRTTQPNGQVGDSGRDQGHAYGELWHYAKVAEAAWKVGVDLFALEGNRLRTCAEYWAQYNNGGTVSWVPAGTCYDVWMTGPNGPVQDAKPEAQHIYHGAYVVRKGLTLPQNDGYVAGHEDDWKSWVFRKSVDRSTATVPGAITFPSGSALTSGLTVANIGGATPAGSASYSGGTWTVRGAGTDIWGAADGCVFAYKTLTGDGVLTARLTAVQATDVNAKAGLMIRENLDADSKMAVIYGKSGTAQIEGTGRGYTAVSHYSASQLHDETRIPYWLRIERRGNRVTVFDSANGTNWTPLKVFEFSMANTYLIGFAVTSHANGTLNTSTFTNASVTGGTGTAPIANGTYSLRNRASGKMLDNLGATTDGANIGQWADGSSNNQRWVVTSVGSYHTLRCVTGSKYLDSLGHSVNDTTVGQWASSTSFNQQWTIQPLTDGFYKVINRANGLALDTGGFTGDSSATSGPFMEFWSSGTSANQQWQFVAP